MKYFNHNVVVAAIVVACMSFSCSGKKDDPVPEKKPVTSVTVSPTTKCLEVNGSVTLSVAVLPADADDKSVSWSSNNTSVATVDTEGKVTAKAVGTATITAASTTDATKSGSCVVTVAVECEPCTSCNDIPLEGVTLVGLTFNESGYFVLEEGDTEDLYDFVEFDPEDTTDDTTIAWTSSAPGVVSVSTSGVITAEKPGRATITGTVGEFTITCQVQVPGVVYEYSEDDLGGFTCLWSDKMYPSESLPDPSIWWIGGAIGSTGFVTLDGIGTVVRLNLRFNSASGCIARWGFPNALFGKTFGASNRIEIDFVYNSTRFRDGGDPWAGHRTLLLATGDIINSGPGYDGGGEGGGFCFDQVENPDTENPLQYYGNWCVPINKIINDGTHIGDYIVHTVSSTWDGVTASYAKDAEYDPATSNGNMGFTSGAGGNGLYMDNVDSNVIYIASIRFLLTEN